MPPWCSPCCLVVRAFISIWSIRKVQVEKTSVSVTLNGTNDFVFIEILLIIPAHEPEGLKIPPHARPPDGFILSRACAQENREMTTGIFEKVGTDVWVAVHDLNMASPG